jgi:hypothetical protein
LLEDAQLGIFFCSIYNQVTEPDNLSKMAPPWVFIRVIQ